MIMVSFKRCSLAFNDAFHGLVWLVTEIEFVPTISDYDEDDDDGSWKVIIQQAWSHI